MNYQKIISRGLILPVVCASSIWAPPAIAAPSKTYTYDGTVANLCRVGNNTSYAVSISAVGTGSMTTTISLDGNAGASQNKNNQNATVTVNYVTICNQTSQKTLTLTAPQAISGANNIAYTFTVMNAANGGGTVVASISTEPGTTNVIIPAQTSATWSIIVTALNKNSQPAGTYTATVTIQ